MPTIQVVQDDELVDVEVDPEIYDRYERFLDPGETEGEEGRAVIYPLIDEMGPEWTIYTYRDGDEDGEPFTTTLHEYPAGVTECKIQHVKAKRLFDTADKVMNEFEFLDEDDREQILDVLRG